MKRAQDHQPIWVAAALLDSECLISCKTRCATKPELECVLLRLAQGNAVKCVVGDGASMKFGGHAYIKKCMELMFNEFEDLRPDVVVLQSRSLLGEAFQEIASRRQLEITGPNRLFIGSMKGQNFRAVVCFLNHPARHLKRDWNSGEIPNALAEAKRLLLDWRDGK